MKKIIKKILVIFIIIFSPFFLKTNIVFWIDYNKIEKKLIILNKKNREKYLKNIKNKVEKIEQKIKKKNIKSKEKKLIILKNLKNIIEKILKNNSTKNSKKNEKKLITKKKNSYKKEQKEISNKKSSKNVNEKINNFRKKFYQKYSKNIISKNPISPLCIKKYDLIDSIAKKNNFPTELIIATWWMEHSCIFDNPENWWWNFQITKNYYKPWKITNKQFAKQIQDFINFSKNKWKFYERYKKFKKNTINLQYNNYDFPSIRYHAIAYNWVINDYYTSKYVNWNLNKNVAYKKDWITTRFLKILAWEIKHKKTWNTYAKKIKIKNIILKDEPKIIAPKKEFDDLKIKKISKNYYKIFWKTNWKLKYIKVLWLNWGKNEKPYKLKSYNPWAYSFFYTIKEKYENIAPWVNKYKFFWENYSWKKFEKILTIKN